MGLKSVVSNQEGVIMACVMRMGDKSKLNIYIPLDEILISLEWLSLTVFLSPLGGIIEILTVLETILTWSWFKLGGFNFGDSSIFEILMVS